MDANAMALLERARTAWDAEEWETAAELYEELLAICPDAPNSYVWWFNGALAYKFVRNWPKAFELGRQAAARSETGKRDPAFWNLGIAATILNDWGVARAAWEGYGIALPDGDGDGEIDGDFGTACVRLETGHAPEVVWVRRICPTRARVLSIPFSDRRFGEVVVHDGAPNGERIVDGRRYPVFDELMLHKASGTPTWRVSLSCPAEADIQALVDGFDAEGLPIEPVSGMVLHSRAESEGSVEIDAGAARSGEHDVLLAAPDEAAARGLLDAWARSGSGGRAWTGLREKIGSIVPAPSAPPAPSHTHEHGERHPVVPHLHWPFDGGVFPSDLGVVAHRSILTGQEPPRLVTHDRDGWWQALDGVNPADPGSAVVACMMCLVELATEVAELADLPPGWIAERDQPGTPWRRSEGTGEQ